MTVVRQTDSGDARSAHPPLWPAVLVRHGPTGVDYFFAAMQTIKVILRTKKDRTFEHQEIEIPTDEAMIEVVQRFRGQAEPENTEVDGWRVRYRPPGQVFTGPSPNLFGEGESYGPHQLTGKTWATCTVGKKEWAAMFVWDDDDERPRKLLTTKGVLEGHPIAIQERLFDWHPMPRPLLEQSMAEEPSNSEGTSPTAVLDLLHEGARVRVHADRYERDPAARAACIEHYGPRCVVCGFNFEATYGDAAAGFIHVHHLRPLSADGEDHVVDPIADLRPLCPNCHSFVHLRVPPLDVEKARGVVDTIRALQSE